MPTEHGYEPDAVGRLAAQRIRILCVDDHPIMREGLAAVLSADERMELVAHASSGEEGIAQFRRWRPDITLMDLRLPGISGVEAIKAIRAEFPQARIIVLTTEAGDVQIQRSLTAGAKGFVLKGMSMDELKDVILAVQAGKTRIPGLVASQLVEHLADKDLSTRELEVLRMVAAGRRNKTIAAALGISEETVKMHVKHVMTKLGADDRTHAVAIALRRGFITL